MSNVAYVPPRVTVSELVSPSFNPSLLDPNTVCIVGPTQGYQAYTEILALVDNHPVTLGATYVDLSTLTIIDASNIGSTPFQASTAVTELDYDIDQSKVSTTGQVSIKRAMQTAIADGQTTVLYFENSASPGQADAHTQNLVLSKTSSAVPTNLTSNTQAASISVQSEGVAPQADYTTSGLGGATPTITWVNTATVLKKFQTVYVDYQVASTSYFDLPVQLNNLTAVDLPADATNITVKTAAGVSDSAATAVVYQKGSTSDKDYIVSGSGTTTTIARSAGTTTMGLTNDQLTVRVTYQATPAVYWQPTQCFSQGDVENKFGPAWDSSGNILNPVSAATALAFSNGVNSVIVQALFTEGTPRTKPSGTVTDWTNTLNNLQTVENISAIVPIISAGGLSTSDAQNLSILEAVQSYINYMQVNQQQYIMAVCGEDSTSGTMASAATLRDHAESLAVLNPAEAMVLIAPAAFTIINPVTGQPFAIGGQYVAACVAGMFGRYNVQTPFTRKRVNALTAVQDIRSEADKNTDAQAGLLEVEYKRGVVQIRHAITVADDTISNQEMNVVRAKYWMIANLIYNLDSQVIGNYVIDANTSFLIQLAVDDVLAQMVSTGAIVQYSNIQVRQNPTLATGFQVQFSYLPAYALNYIDITFSIDSSTGITLTTAALPSQGQGLS